jgi:GNAT superfamily N-acetyltransferase
MKIMEITNACEKKAIARAILEALPDWFGIAEAREEYIRDSEDKSFFCACIDGQPVGFLYLKQTGDATAELAVMGIVKEHHRKGIGKALFEQAKESAKGAGYAFLQVKTVQMGRYEEYDRTNRFYLSLGFREFEVFPTLWDEGNPCQVYVMAL